MPITGCAYYPEHWDESRWAEDARLMREAGLSVVRLAEFAWDKMEPEEGEYDWAWLDKAITLLAEAGLKIVLCTPTPTPPPWLTHKHPDICRVREDGTHISAGARRHATANSPAYWQYSQKIVEAITARYGKHEALIGWQVDNEFGCGETTRSYGEHDRRAFHLWLKQKYGTLEALNAAWGTQFWGMTYRAWEHIPIIGITTEPQSPAMRLDYYRFSSDAWVKFQKMQIEIIRRNSPERFVTHNFMIRHWSLDYWELAKDLDFVSYDNYPQGLRNPAEVSMNLDLMWSLKRRSFWVMEQQTGQVNWHPYNPPVPPGQVKVWSHQAVAHGAEAVIYFRYRAARFGTEQRHAGLLKWDASLDQAYHEASQVSETFQSLPANLQRPQAKIGIVFDYESLWSLEMEPHTQEFSYWELVYELYKYFWDANIPVDFLPREVPAEILKNYEVVLVPAAVLRRTGELLLYNEWVSAGGTLILTFRTGYREESNISVDTPLPSGWTSLIGAEVQEWGSIPPASYLAWESHRAASHIESAQEEDSTLFRCKIWAESLKLNTATALKIYADGIWGGKAAISSNRVGAGEVVYVGCWLEDWSVVLDQQGCYSLQEATLMDQDNFAWRISINHSVNPLEDDSADGFAVYYEKIES